MTGRNASATATFGVLPWLGPRMPRTILLSLLALAAAALPARPGHPRRGARRDLGARGRRAARDPLLAGRRAPAAVAGQAVLRRDRPGVVRLERLRAGDRGRP